MFKNLSTGYVFAACRVLLVALFIPINSVSATKSTDLSVLNTVIGNPEPKIKGKIKNGQKHGFWRYYHEGGWEEKREKWENGNLMYTLFFNKQHKKVKWIGLNGTEKIYKNCNCSN